MDYMYCKAALIISSMLTAEQAHRAPSQASQSLPCSSLARPFQAFIYAFISMRHCLLPANAADPLPPRPQNNK